MFDIVENQVRALRSRDLIGRFEAAQAARAKGTLQPAGIDPDARFGAFWGIDTDPAKAVPPGALPCAPATITTLAISPRGSATSARRRRSSSSTGAMRSATAACAAITMCR
ncbi:MAG TPA: hypothetical protein VII40_20295, partial [Xanthobacteraceae bacterium]